MSSWHFLFSAYGWPKLQPNWKEGQESQGEPKASASKSKLPLQMALQPVVPHTCPALAPSQPEWSLYSVELGGPGQARFSSFTHPAPVSSSWTTYPDLPYPFLLRGSRLHWPPAFIQWLSTQHKGNTVVDTVHLSVHGHSARRFFWIVDAPDSYCPYSHLIDEETKAERKVSCWIEQGSMETTRELDVYLGLKQWHSWPVPLTLKDQQILWNVGTAWC